MPVGLPSNPRPVRSPPTNPGRQRSLTTAPSRVPTSPGRQRSLTTAPSRTRIDNQKRSSRSTPSESLRSTRAALNGKVNVPDPPASEKQNMSSHRDHGDNMPLPLSTNSPYVEQGETNQSGVSSSTPYSGDTAWYYWNRVGEVATSLVQWKVAIPVLGDKVDEVVEDDSHLVKVMRAYHLKKVQTLEDLPDWLFDEKERGKMGGLRNRQPEKVAATGREVQRDRVIPPKQGLNHYSGGSLGHSQRILMDLRRKRDATRNTVESL